MSMILRTLCGWKTAAIGIGNFTWVVRRRTFFASKEAVIDIASKHGELRVFIVAGEVSGDAIGSRFMGSLKNLASFPVHFSGVGGSMMSKQGLNSLFPMEDIAVMGIWELLPHLNKIRVRLKETVEAALSFRPHVVVTVDAKGFSFRFLKQLRASYNLLRLVSPPHFHYVAPSFWAWRGGEARLKGLTEFVDHILCILPFEAYTCELNGLSATFVGHPSLEDVLDLKGNDTLGKGLPVMGNAENFKNEYGIPSGSTVISVLPGSRLQEVIRMLPVFLNTLEVLKVSSPELIALIHVAPNQHVENFISKAASKSPVPVILIPGASCRVKYNSFSASRVALCTSGTAAVELQLARLPCIVAYRAHLLTEWIIRYKAKVQYMSLPNILLDSPVLPEILFRACEPSVLALLLTKLINDDSLRDEQINAAEKVIQLLSPPKRTINNLIKWDMSHDIFPSTPSTIAAFTVLYSKRT